jgi:hypothetical protein
MEKVMRKLMSILGLVFGAYMLSGVAVADDMESFATGGYARGLRTQEQMDKIDTDGDGRISKAEWLAYQEKVFAALDKNKTGKLSVKQFTAPSSEMAEFATGGYARGLQTPEMLRKIDTNGDGTISHKEFMAYQAKIFDMMKKDEQESIGPQEFLGR